MLKIDKKSYQTKMKMCSSMLTRDSHAFQN